MPENEKKAAVPANPFEGKEVLIGSLVRRWFKPFMENKVLDGLRRTNEPAWMATAWMYKKNSPTKLVFTGTLLAGLTGAENLLDWMRQKTGLVGQLVSIAGQQVLEDVEGTVREYFERQSDEIFVGYNGPKDSDLASLSKVGNLHIKQNISNFFSRLPMLLVFNKDGAFHGPGWDLAMSMLMADDAAFDNFRSWYKAADKPLKDRAKRVVTTINNSGEFNLFAAKTPEQMTDQINIAYDFTRTTFVTDEELSEVTELFDKAIGQHAQNFADELNKTFPVNLDRKAEHARRRRQRRFQSHPVLMVSAPAAIASIGAFLATWVASHNPSTQPTYRIGLKGAAPVLRLIYEPHGWLLAVFGLALGLSVFVAVNLHNKRRAQ